MADRELAGRIAATFASKAIVFVLGAVAGVALARALGPAGRGRYAVLVTIATTASTVSHASVEQSNLYLWHRGESREALATNSLAVASVNGAAIAAFALLLLLRWWRSAVPTADHHLLLVALGAIPFMNAAIYFNGLVLLDDRVERMNTARVLAAAGQCGSLLILWVAGLESVGSVVLVWTLSYVLTVALLLPGFGVRREALSWRGVAAAETLGLKYHVGMAAIFLLWRVDVLLLAARVSAADVGLYGLAVSLAELVYLATDSLTQVTLARQTRGEYDEAARYASTVARVNMVVGAAAMLGISLAAPVLVPLAFGHDFRHAVAPLWALAPGVVALGAIRPVGVVLVRLNRPLAISSMNLAALALNVVLNLVLIPRQGIVGAALASTIAYGALAAASITLLSRTSDVRMADLRPTSADVNRVVTGTLKVLTRRRVP